MPIVERLIPVLTYRDISAALDFLVQVLELGERGLDLGDVQGWLGHRQVSATRRHYAPLLASRLKQASEMQAGRFHGWQPDGERNDSSPSTSPDVTPEADDIAAVETDGRIH